MRYSSLAMVSCLALAFAWGAALPGSMVHAQQPLLPQQDALSQVLALQQVIEKAVQRAEPAIACILVSRSELYKKLQLAPQGELDGKLGGVNPSILPGLLNQLYENKKTKEQIETICKKLDLSDPEVVPESFGSGVVVDRKGLILTNYHVVRDATKLFVRLPGGKGSYADILAADPRSDLAVLRVLDDRLVPLKTIPIGNATNLKRGQFVLSLANPFAAGFRDGQPSVSWGVLSNIRRRAPGQPREIDRTRPLHYYGTLLQLDARLHLGCSGGALLNLQGEMIGLTSALAAIHGGETPGGFAVPLDAGFRRILEVLLRGEEVDYAFLGVAFQQDGPDDGRGIPLSYVTPGSAADTQAHLRMGERIVAIDGEPIRDSDDLLLQLGTHLAGSRVRLRVRRLNGVQEEVNVELAKFYVPGPKIYTSLGKRPFFRGLRVDYTSLLVQLPPRGQLRKIPAGVMISDVQSESSASSAQLRVGEVISHVNGRPIADPAAFYAAVERTRGTVELTLSGYPEYAPTKVLLK